MPPPCASSALSSSGHTLKLLLNVTAVSDLQATANPTMPRFLCAREHIISNLTSSLTMTLFCAQAVANQTSATFLRVVGSELIQKYLGDGPRLVRELFRVADDLSPTIVFIGAPRQWLSLSSGNGHTLGC